MAVLPLAGWAEKTNISDFTVTLSSDPALTYNGMHQAFPTVASIAKAATTVEAAALEEAANWTISWTYAGAAYNPAGTAITNAGNYTVTIAATAANATFTGSVSKVITVAKAGTIKVEAKNPTMVYGGTTPVITDFYKIADGSDDFISGEGVATLGHPVDMPVVDMVNAGTKDFSLTAREYVNYDVAVINPYGTLSIAKKSITVTTAPIANITYGAAKPNNLTLVDYSDQLVGNDELNDDNLVFEFKKVVGADETLIEDAILPAGDYRVYPKGLSNDNYAITYAYAAFTVAKKALAPSMITLSEDKEYSGATQEPTLTVADGTTPIVAADYVATWTYSTDGETWNPAPTGDAAFKNAGLYKVTLTQNGDTHNYKTPAGTTAEPAAAKTYEITKASLYIKTQNKSKTYDGQTAYDPQSNATVKAAHLTFVGLVGTDAPVVTGLTVSLGDVEGKRTGIDAGEYPINVTGTLDASLAKNYTAQFGNLGKLTINKRPITLTANADGKKYMEEDNYVAGVTALGVISDPANANYNKPKYVKLTGTLADGDVIAMPTLTRNEGETASSATNVYTITPSDFEITYTSGGSDPVVVDNTANYEITPGTAIFTISKGGFTIWADDKESVYGSTTLQTLSATVDGIPQADAELIVFEEGAITTDAQVGDNRGTYTITLHKDKIDCSAIAGKYDIDAIVYVPGNYTITPKALKIKAKDQAHILGETVTDANLKNIEFVTEGVSATDKAGVVANITLSFYKGATASAADVPVSTVSGHEGELLNSAATTGWTGTAAAVADKDKGVWVNGIVITFDDTDAYWTTANYTLDPDVEAGAGVEAGTLYVTTANTPVTFDILATATTQISNVAGKIVDAQISLDEAGKKRTLYANEWNSLVLPFDITPFAFCDAIDGYAVFDVLQTTGEAMNFKITINEIPAYTPFLVKVSETVVLSEKQFEGVVIKAIADAAVANDAYIFQGNLAMSTPVPAWLFTADSEHSSTVEFGSIDLYHNVENAPTTAPNRPCPAFGAYIKAKPGVQAAPSIFIEEADGSTTAITAINADGVAVKAEGWYTINGVKLQGMPTEKGIYINNGKKIVIK